MRSVAFTPSPELFPFESRWLDTPAGAVHYVDEGEGRPILFLHGNPTWSFLYRDLVARLRERFRCIAVDYPGFGLSARPADYEYTPDAHAEIVSALIEHLDLDDLIIMGQDWGGPIGVACALEAPGRIGGFVFGNTWLWPVDDWRIRAFSRLMSTRWMQRAILERNFFVERMIPAGTARHLTDAEMEHYRAVQPDAAARVGVALLPRALRFAAPWLEGLYEDAAGVLHDRPALLTWGMRDFAFRARTCVPRFRAIFDDVTFVALESSRHFIQEDQPLTIADAIRARFYPGSERSSGLKARGSGEAVES